MLSFIDDLAGAIYDVFSVLLKGLSYILAGMIIVAVPLYVIMWILMFVSEQFFH
ncbi:hypothetical protein QWY14_14665 [Planococcus sp. N028]|uniref:Uncharacterized protein n=1 Tax=Planococcus shixiaomingii TaxID=3058393 RepID=A0ABT8N584_9BACL|nr:hypothetical protein [Planococcus sp. N028]MDN7243044.1 hypothetical protein [Planococcus sp. N028]